MEVTSSLAFGALDMVAFLFKAYLAIVHLEDSVKCPATPQFDG